MTRWLHSLARRCSRRGWLVVGIWLAVAVAVMGANRIIGGAVAQTYDLPGTDSAVAQDLLNRAFPGSATESIPVVLHDPASTLDVGGGGASVAAVASALADVDVVTSVVAPADDTTLVSDDGHTALVQVKVTDRSSGEPRVGQELLDTARAAAPEGMQVELGGFLGRQVSRPDTRRSELVGVFAAIVVLFITLRRFPAVAIPLLNAVLSVGIGLALVGLLGSLVFIPDVATTLGTMLGLGVGIDYALFLVVRHRTLLRQGYDVHDSVGRTAGTAGAGIVFAGGTLIAAVCGLALTGLSFLAWLGISAALVVTVAVIASFTLVPALLGIAGRRVLPRSMQEQVTDTDEALDHSRWARLAQAVTRRPWRFAIASTIMLLLMAAPALTLTLGHTDASTLPPETTARKADDLMRSAFGAGSTAPLAVVTQLWAVAADPAAGDAGAPPASSTTGDPRAGDPRLVALAKVLAGTPGVTSVDAPVVSTDGGVAIIRVVPDWGSADRRTEELVARLRADVLPRTTAGQGMSSHIGGVTAGTTDLSTLVAARTPWFIVGVVTLSFLLLTVAYRSLLIPFKAAMMNLLSIAAAYGVVTMVFQWGWGAHLIGLDGPVPIESYVPMMMFAVLFGLSMDYEVFLLTAFREHWERSGDMTTAVRRGLADTGRVVTAAALIMVSVFASFVLSTDPLVKLFGVGLSTAVAIDATIVRCLLVPAILVLVQKGTWWLPAWLDELLPQLHVEGDPKALGAAAERPAMAATGRRPLVRQRPAAVLATVLGVGLAWVLASRLPVLPAGAGTTVAVAAVLGGVLVLLPPSLGGARTSVWTRLGGYVGGAVVTATVLAIIEAVVPPVGAAVGSTVAVGLVVVALVIVLVIARPAALSMVLGAVAAVVAAVSAPVSAGASTLSLLVAVLLPAVVAVVVAEATTSLTSGTAADGGTTGPATPTEHATPAAPSEPETSLESLLSGGREVQDGTP